MEPITGITRGGTVYTPAFVTKLNQATCIGCGRCYKVCSRDVFELLERNEDDESYDEDEDNTMVMSIANAKDCIGCASCSRVCPKQCHTHEALPLAV